MGRIYATVTPDSRSVVLDGAVTAFEAVREYDIAYFQPTDQQALTDSSTQPLAWLDLLICTFEE